MTTTLIRRAGLLAVLAATTLSVSACAAVFGAKMTYDDVEKAKITEIRVAGGSGDIVVRAGAAGQTTIRRIVRGSSNPGESYRLDGTVLTVDTGCGVDCRVSYEIQTPAGATVSGELGSGNVDLEEVGTTDLRVTSGDVLVRHASGPVRLRGTSGDIRVLDATSTVTVQSTSGDISAIGAVGAVDLRVTSGDIVAQLDRAASVTAQATSGDVRVTVPAGSYRVDAHARAGDTMVAGITSDPSAKNVISVRTASGDASVHATA